MNNWDKSGLKLSDAMDVFNCTQSYIYCWVREGKLTAVPDTKPMKITTDSIITKLRRMFPCLIDNCFNDYYLKQKAQSFA